MLHLKLEPVQTFSSVNGYRQGGVVVDLLVGLAKELTKLLYIESEPLSVGVSTIHSRLGSGFSRVEV